MNIYLNIYKLKANKIIKNFHQALKNNNLEQAKNLILNDKYQSLNSITENYEEQLTPNPSEIRQLNNKQKPKTIYDHYIKKCLLLSYKYNQFELFKEISLNTISLYQEETNLILNNQGHSEFKKAKEVLIDIIINTIENHNFKNASFLLDESTKAHKQNLLFQKVFHKHLLNTKFKIDNKILDFYFKKTDWLDHMEIQKRILKEKQNSNTCNKTKNIIVFMAENNFINQNNYLDYVCYTEVNKKERIYHINKNTDLFDIIINKIFKEDKYIVSKTIQEIINNQEKNSSPLKSLKDISQVATKLEAQNIIKTAINKNLLEKRYQKKSNIQPRIL